MTYTTGDTLLNKYRIERLLGRGGFAEVYLAAHLDLKGLRALKVLRRDAMGLGSSDYNLFEERFRVEAELGDMFDHPNLVRVHDFERDAGTLILVMEYCAGGSLANRLYPARGKVEPLPVDQAIQLGLDVSSGLAELHHRDIVHRDLKPNNILFDARGRAKVSDLGLAQTPGGLSQRSLLGSLAVKHPGTPGYMSPEQEKTTDYLRPPSDVYALALVLFEALTGRVVQNLKPGTRLQSLRTDAPGWLDELLAQMLLDDPRSRPWDGEEVLGLLKQGGHGEVRRQQEEKERLAAVEAERHKAEEKQRQADEVSRQAAEEQRRLAVERERQAAEEKQRQAAEQERLEAEDRQRKEAEERRRQELEEKHRREEEERKRINAEQKVRQEAEEKNQNGMTITLAPGVEMVFLRVPAGEFWMGSDDSDKEAKKHEKPQHKVYLDEYWIGKYPVTNAQYQAYVKTNWVKGWKFETGKESHPAVNVGWKEAVGFCEWVSQVSRRVVRLPTEAEWEKAARGSDKRIYPWGNERPDKSRANYNSLFKVTTPVGQFSPQGDSPYGCADMAGNVWEWVSDWYNGDYYSSQLQFKNPVGPDKGISRVVRGGSFVSPYYIVLRTMYRLGALRDSRYFIFGFRCAAPQAP